MRKVVFDMIKCLLAVTLFFVVWAIGLEVLFKVANSVWGY